MGISRNISFKPNRADWLVLIVFTAIAFFMLFATIDDDKHRFAIALFGTVLVAVACIFAEFDRIKSYSVLTLLAAEAVFLTFHALSALMYAHRTNGTFQEFLFLHLNQGAHFGVNRFFFFPAAASLVGGVALLKRIGWSIWALAMKQVPSQSD